MTVLCYETILVLAVLFGSVLAYMIHDSGLLDGREQITDLDYAASRSTVVSNRTKALPHTPSDSGGWEAVRRFPRD